MSRCSDMIQSFSVCAIWYIVIFQYILFGGSFGIHGKSPIQKHNNGKFTVTIYDLTIYGRHHHHRYQP